MFEIFLHPIAQQNNVILIVLKTAPQSMAYCAHLRAGRLSFALVPMYLHTENKSVVYWDSFLTFNPSMACYCIVITYLSPV